jgi:hypothetical protein
MTKALKTISYENGDNGEIYRKNSYVDMQFDEEDGYLFWRQKACVKMFIDQPLPDVFSFSDRGRISEMRHYMLRNNQFLAYKSGNYIKPIGIPELCKIFELGNKKCRTFVRKLKDNAILKEVKFAGLTYFVVNPIYFLKAKRIDLTLYLWFQEELKEVMPIWVINKFLEQAKELKPDIQIIK